MRVAEVSSGEINHVQIPATLTEFLQFPPLSATEEKQCHLLPNFRANLPNKVSRVLARSRPARVFGAAFSDGVHLSARNDRRAFPQGRVGNVRVRARMPRLDTSMCVSIIGLKADRFARTAERAADCQ